MDEGGHNDIDKEGILPGWSGGGLVRSGRETEFVERRQWPGREQIQGRGETE